MQQLFSGAIPGPGGERIVRTTATTCPYCGVGCGLSARVRSDGTVTISGDPAHPANLGRLCSKGAALGETLSIDDRLLQPMIAGERTSWGTALDLVARRFAETIADHGPDSVALYVSGQLLTEDYYVANKLMKGYVGTANIDTNSRLCMASSVAGHKRAFGSDTVPGCYEDLEEADLVVLVGSNLAWCHPVLFQRLAAGRERRGTKVVVIDPRRTASSEIADLHLALRPDSDVALFAGLLQHIAASGALDRGFVWRHTSGLLAALKAAQPLDAAEVAAQTGLRPEQISAFYELFTATERVVTVYSQGVNQSACGTDKVNAIINCHLATGRIGKPGCGPFSVTGQPNAMGGREVGGLANMLAAHMEIADPAHRRIVQDFWRSPRIASAPGWKAVDLFRAIGTGRIKAVWIMATNPVDSLPEADGVRSALAACPFVVVSDVVRSTDTTALAHVLLPSLAWGEKDGTVTNSERRISRQRAFLPTPGEARADWWQITEVARRLGFADGFAYESAAQIFDEHARLSAASNGGTRDFDIGGLAGLHANDYDALEPVQWPRPAGAAPRPRGPERLFSQGGFFTPDRRARLIPSPVPLPHGHDGPLASAPSPSESGLLVLNTGRIRDQWHTMTRTAKTPRLMTHIAEPFVELAPRDAAERALAPAGIARLASCHGSMLARVVVTDRQQAGSVFVPMHWTDQHAAAGRVGALVGAAVDPHSGQPALKQMPVSVEAYPAHFYAVAVSRRRPFPATADGAPGYWAVAPVRGGWRTELADPVAPADLATFLATHFIGAEAGTADLVTYADRSSGESRLAAFIDGRLEALLYAARAPVAVSRTWLAEQLTPELIEPADRLRMLAGRPGAGRRDPGAIVCACFEVGCNDIRAAVLTKGCTTVAAVGSETKAGTNCGSCRAEIGRLIDAHDLAQAD